MDQIPLFEAAISNPKEPCSTQCDGLGYGDIFNALEMQGPAFNLSAEG